MQEKCQWSMKDNAKIKNKTKKSQNKKQIWLSQKSNSLCVNVCENTVILKSQTLLIGSVEGGVHNYNLMLI